MRQVRDTFAARFAFGVLEAGLGLVFLGAVVDFLRWVGPLELARRVQ